ncbi:cytochrome P450 [Mycena pura]|uniref:Cytochrome P450 n=1 Tax=Mycena pura TaxID=153505 RepID=A0AAD6YJN7_9AGAR|nr:cytochrome P450 [Mycena pura]
MQYLQFLIAALLGLPPVIFLAHLVFYFVDPYGLRQYPGPFLARLTPAWLGWAAQQVHRAEAVHEAHKKYGPFVRISPSEVSVAVPEALPIVYGHGNGALKSSFYDSFISIGGRAIFSTLDRVQHARKRKTVAHIFSPKSVLDFEHYIRVHITTLLGQWERMYDDALKGLSGPEGEGWTGRDGRLWFDCRPWIGYLALDTIGDLAFGAPFGMLAAGHDAARVPATAAARKDAHFKKTETTHAPAIALLNGRGEYVAAMGVLPAWWRPLAAYLPWYRARAQSASELAGMAIVAVAKRLATPSDRVDVLSKLLDGKDEHGQPLGREELTVEAHAFLIAGSDTTATSLTAIMFHIAANPAVQERLQEELDVFLGIGDDPIAWHEQVKHLTYLDACINEGLRVNCTNASGLPRVVPEGGLVIRGRHFPAGAVVGVPIYTVHRDPDVWGDDADVYRPERWLDADSEKAAMMQKTFTPFSSGPRACIGRNLALLEIVIIVATLFRRYNFVLAEPDKPIETREGFLRKPVHCNVGIKRRDV